MRVLLRQFDSSLNQCSPVQPDFERVVNYDKEGNEYISYVEVDYPSLQKSHGLITDWSLDSLLKSGVNPSFPIRTGLPTRLEGIGFVDQAAAIADSIISSDNSKTE